MTPFSFDEQQFSRIFPFYVLINKSLQVVSTGKSIQKTCQISSGTLFNEVFVVKRPQIAIDQFDTFLALQNQLVVVESLTSNNLVLRGQIEYLPDTESVLFIGSPWFGSMDQVIGVGLNLHDFAYHDPLIDLLHVLKTQEIVTDDIKKLLLTVNKQRNDLKQLSLIAQQTLNGILITNEEGEIEWVNNAFAQMTGYEMNEIAGRKPGSFLQGIDSDPETIAYMRAQVQKGESFSCEIVNYSKSGSPYWGKVSGQAIRDKSGKITQFFAIQEDITKQKTLELEIEQQRNFYEDILNNIPADIAVFSNDHRYLFLNPMAVKNPEIRKWMIGKRDEDYIAYRNKPPELAQKRRDLFTKVSQSKKLLAFEEELTNSSGNKEYILRKFYPVLDEAGELKLIIGYGMDITEMKSIQFELEQSRHKTEELAKAKQQFLANMSHEIRTPMNGILGISSLFEKTPMNAQQQEFINLIQESAKNLLVIVNDVLDLEKIIAGKVDLEELPFNLADKVYITTESFRFKAKEKNIKFTYRNHLPSNLVVLGDPFRLSQILNNLISNAIKFTDHGMVLISTELKQQQEDEVWIIFTVKDTGIGVDRSRIEDIFEPFTQEKAETTRRFGGTGLGLSICRELVRMLGGTISLTSDVGEGSSFSFEIPYKLSAAVIPTVKKKFMDLDLVKNLRILVAEDVDINQFLIRHILQAWGCHFSIEANGRLAVDALQKDDYDLILMDIQMDEMDGLEATKVIRAMNNQQKAKIPIVALTANALRGDFETYIEAGMDAYLPKPFSDNDLYEVILNVLEKKRLKNAALTVNNFQQVTARGALYNLSMLESMSKGDKGFVAQMVRLFLDTMPPLQQHLQDSAQEANWIEVSKTAHKMKPALDSMGISALRNTIRTVEQNAKTDAQTDELLPLITEINRVIDECRAQLNTEFG